jgi:hypothetical protein
VTIRLAEFTVGYSKAMALETENLYWMLINLYLR